MPKDNENIPFLGPVEPSEPQGFSADQMIRCEECLRANPPTRASCLYCAAPLPLTETSARLIKPVLRPPEKHQSGYNNILLPHEHAEDRSLYPALAGPLGSSEATVSMSRMHAEIDRLAYRLHAHLASAEAAGVISGAQTEDLLACLFGLDALLSLHFLTEEENYFALLAEDVAKG